MNKYEENIDRMLSFWNIENPDERERIVNEVLEHNVYFVDPPYNIIGRKAFLDMVASTREANPGLTYSRSSHIDEQHRFCRYDWNIKKAGKVVMTGLDVVKLSDAGKILKVIGFFGALKPL